jgi:hypothetical protein
MRFFVVRSTLFVAAFCASAARRPFTLGSAAGGGDFIVTFSAGGGAGGGGGSSSQSLV